MRGRTFRNRIFYGAGKKAVEIRGAIACEGNGVGLALFLGCDAEGSPFELVAPSGKSLMGQEPKKSN